MPLHDGYICHWCHASKLTAPYRCVVLPGNPCPGQSYLFGGDAPSQVHSDPSRAQDEVTERSQDAAGGEPLKARTAKS